MVSITKYPIRIAKTSIGYKLFQTKTFNIIMLDDDSYMLFQLFSSNVPGNIDSISEKLSAKYNIKYESIQALINFLIQEGFLIEKNDPQK